MRWLYLSLALLGAALPYSQLIPWLALHGLNIRLLFTDLFSSSIGAFFGLDVILSAVVLLIFISRDGVARGMRALWLPRESWLRFFGQGYKWIPCRART